MDEIRDFIDRKIWWPWKAGRLKNPLAFDIETKAETITMIGFAPSIDEALCIPFLDPRKRPSQNYWETLEEELEAWGLDLPMFGREVDYSILDDDLSDKMDELSDGVKKAIQIEFDPQDYDEAYELVKFWRERGAYVGALIIEHLRREKSKL
jgi:hypothetical protein